jgi:membrane fusion protein (multidrug efflux system)
MDITTMKLQIKTWMQQHRRHLLVGGPTLLLLIVGIFYVTAGRYVSTDDAYVQAARIDISSNVSARAIEIAVRDNQTVQQGELLFKLDNRDYIIALKDAKAKLANTKLQIIGLKATYLQYQAEVQSAKATLDYAEREFKRQSTLAAEGISSQAQLDKARQAYATAKQQLNAAEQQRDNILASLDNKPNINVNKHPAVQQAQAALDQAKLNLSYTVITAPTAGMVTKVEQLQVGDYVKAAAPVFALIATNHVWVEANFKETQLTHVRPGQSATIKVDIYPGRTFHGHVLSISPATGSSFALLPPENATGNWVKVVQRLPVRVSIDDNDNNLPLRMGLSVTVNVDTHSVRTKEKAQHGSR